MIKMSIEKEFNKQRKENRKMDFINDIRKSYSKGGSREWLSFYVSFENLVPMLEKHKKECFIDEIKPVYQENRVWYKKRNKSLSYVFVRFDNGKITKITGPSRGW